MNIQEVINSKQLEKNKNLSLKMKAITISFLWTLLLTIFPVISGVIATIRHTDTIATICIQGIFMVIPTIIVCILILTGKFSCEDLKLNLIKLEDQKKLFGKKFFLMILPIIIYIPHAMDGFTWKGLQYFSATFFLYLFVGISEELFFRGMIPVTLDKAFKDTGVLIGATLFFAIAHIASALTGLGLLLTILTIINAALFGLMAMAYRNLCGTILPIMLIHFLFDLESKFTVISGTRLVIAEGVRGFLLLVLSIIYIIIGARDHKSQEKRISSE